MSFDALVQHTIRRATGDDAAHLSRFARDAFVQAFGADNTPNNMAMYIAKSFSDDIQRAEIGDAQNTFLLAERDGEIIGYVLLREGPAPDAVQSQDALEIKRLYAAPQLVGSGIGATLMQRAMAASESRGRDTIWLAVWEHNPRAIHFYQRWGFQDVGTQHFTLGVDRQNDRVMSRAVVR